MRLTSLTDYAVVMLSAAARHAPDARLTATLLAEETGVPLPTAQKLMGRLAVCGLLVSARGTGGGFVLARPAAAISLADIVEAVEGADRDDHLRGRDPPRLRAGGCVPGKAALVRRERRREGRAGGRIARHPCRPRRRHICKDSCMTPQAATDVRNREALDAAEKASTYEWGFNSTIEQEFAPKGLNEDIVRFISAKKNEPEWMLEWRLKAVSLVADDGIAGLGEAERAADRLSGRVLLCRAQGEADAGIARRGRSRDPARLRKAGHPDRGAEGARRGRGRPQGGRRCRVRQRFRRHHLPRRA